MWYQLYDTQSKIWRGVNHYWQQFDQYLTSNQTLSKTPPVKLTSAVLRGADRIFKEYAKPKFNIHTVTDSSGHSYNVLEKEVLDLPFCRLLSFQKEGALPNGHAREICVVAPLSGHYATLLRDMVARLTADADIVWVTDWKNARDIPLQQGSFHFSDYVKYVETFLTHIGRRVHVVAVCQPAVPVLVAAARMAEAGDTNRPLSMTLMGGPIDARESPTLVDSYATKHTLDWFKTHVISTVPISYAGAGRRVYPGFLQHFGFVAMNPQRHRKAFQDFLNNLVHGNEDDVAKYIAFYNEYNAVLDLDAAFYLETIDAVFQRFTLAEGTMEIDGSRVKPACIKDIPIFTVEGEKDDIAGVGQTKAAHKLCKALPDAMKKHWEVPNVGHYGVFSGSTFRTKIAPEMFNWMDQAKAQASKRG